MCWFGAICFGALPAELSETSRAPRARGLARVDIGVCDQETLDFASSLGGAADVIFTCAQPQWSLAGVGLSGRVTLYLDGVGDPGNVGTLVRSGVAFGLAGVICSPGTADPYGPKAMRAGMGAQFALPVVIEVAPGDLVARLAALAERGLQAPAIWVADPHEGEDVRDVRAPDGAIVVLGAERSGPGPAWAGSRRVCIPQARVRLSERSYGRHGSRL